MKTTAAAVAAAALLVVATAGRGAEAALNNGYVNKPFADPTNNPELNTNGYALTRGGSSSLVYVPQEKAWCQSNSECATHPAGQQNCYGVFYFPTSFNNGTTYDFPNCSLQNGTSSVNFAQYNMSYLARLYLMDLDQNGYSNIVLNATNNPADTCATDFTDFCYLMMWAWNIRAGWGCPQAASNSTFRGQQLLPLCQERCYHLIESSCTNFPMAVLPGAYSSQQFCELFPTSNCIGAASLLSISPLIVMGMIILALLAASL